MPEREMGDVATRVLFENDRVRIWEMDLPAGEASPVHRHDLDYVLVQISGDRIAGVYEPDSAGPYTGVVEADVVAGQVIYIDRGGIEVAKNIGNERYHEILIELK